MADKHPIHLRNLAYIEDLRNDSVNYLNFLSAMSKFYRHNLADLPTFVMEAPRYFSAVATKEVWEKFGYKIKDNANGVTLLAENEQITRGYNITEISPIKNAKIQPIRLWKYYKNIHRPYLDAAIPGNASTTEKIMELSERIVANTSVREENKALVANSIAYVILQRLGESTELPVKNIVSANLSEQDINMEELTNVIHQHSRQVLDAFKAIAERKNKENNPLLDLVNNLNLGESVEQDNTLQEGEVNSTVVEEVETESEEKIQEDEQRQPELENEETKQGQDRANEAPISSADNKNVENHENIEISETITDVIGDEISNTTEKVEVVKGNERDETITIPKENVEVIEQNLFANTVPNLDDSEKAQQEIADVPKTIDVQAEIVGDSLNLTVDEALTRINGNSYEKNMFRDNVRAIITLKNLKGREATEAEKEVLKKYHGFGGLADAFSDKEGWQSEARLLSEILTVSEYNEARSTVLNAHYTDPAIVRGIYNGISQLGFNGGRVLEPSMGIGAFLESMPEEMRKTSDIHGIELDSITGRIAKAVNTDANIQIKGFEKAKYGGNAFDLTISNVPFGNYSVNDSAYNRYSMPIHDYFALKMLDETRPNGITAIITSHGTMDKLSASTRIEFNNKAELVRAIRLPNTAFKGAGTSVTTDILIFRKREKELYLTADSPNLPSWIHTQSFKGDSDININSYFAEHPEYVLGDLKKTTNAYGYEITCEGSSDNLEEQISNAFKGLASFYVPEENPQKPVDEFADNIIPSSFQIINDEIFFIERNGKQTKMELSAKEAERIRLVLPVRDALKRIIDEQVYGVSDKEFEELKAKLNETYDNYVKGFGRIRNDTILKKVFSEDNSYRLLLSLEVFEKNNENNKLEFKGKAPIFFDRVINAYKPPTSAETSKDALAISMQQKGHIDIAYMSMLTNKPREEVLGDLYGKEIFFDYDTGYYVTVDEYLSGDVRAKLEKLENRLNNLSTRHEQQAIDDVMSKMRPLPDRFITDAKTPLDVLLDKFYESKSYRPYKLEDHLKRKSYKIDDVLKEARENPGTLERLLIYGSQYFIEKHGLDLTYKVNRSNLIPYIFKGKEYYEDDFFSAIIQGVNYHSDEDSRDYVRAFSQILHGAWLEKDINKARIFTNFLYETAESYASPEGMEKLNNIFQRNYAMREEFQKEIGEKFIAYKKEIEDKIQRRSLEIAEASVKSNALEKENLLIGIDALKKVVPKDLSAEDIHVELGATWIPITDYETFMEEVLGQQFPIEYSGGIGNGSWKIDGASRTSSNKAINVYGTEDYNGIEIMESLLNLKTPKVNKKIEVGNETKTVVDQEATLKVQQKAEEIKLAFRDWLWSDDERKERLVKYYNRHFNNIVPRSFNGDDLIFPAMSPDIKLRKHQKDAIARTLFGSTNALFAHSVGAGKTFEIVASIMESKRLGLAKKSLIVVPKHITEQFGTEFLQLYPTANILVANSEEFTQAKTAEFCSKIATGDWDAVIMSFNQFERIPLSKERQEAAFQKEIDKIMWGIRKAKKEEGSQFTVKQAEAYKKRIEARLARLQKDDKRDYVVNFEDLGIDHLYVDEAHNYKNLFTFTKLANVSGVNNSDAQKTQDMLFKCQYLNEMKKGHCNIVFATGTPISNSMTELYTMQRYLVPEKLEENGFDCFDSWASTFGKVETVMELKPEGKGFQPRTRFSKFYNLPELLTSFKDFADIKLADELNLDVPTAKYELANMQPTAFQKEYVNELAERAKRIRNGGVDPEEDNMLLITNEGRKLALDQRLIDPNAPDDPNSKVNQCVRNVLEVHKEHPTEAQLIFCDISTPQTSKSKDTKKSKKTKALTVLDEVSESKESNESAVGDDFNVYKDIKEKLIAGGLKAKEIAFIHNAKTDEQKDALFAKVRSGEVKVLLGSTSMMGTGTNVQDHLIALHDLDIPWRPSDLEQRMGRIVRQGNQNKNVKIFRYVTEGTFDAYLWQILENKQRFISQVMTSKSVERAAEDVDEATLSYAEIKAIATGNPLIKEKIDVDMQISKLKYAKDTFNAGQARMKRMLEFLPKTIQKNKASLEIYEQCSKFITNNLAELKSKEKDFLMEINGVSYYSYDDAVKELRSYKDLKGSFMGFKGKCYGMPFEIGYDGVEGLNAKMTSPDGKLCLAERINTQVPSTISYIVGLAKRYVDGAKNLKKLIATDEENLRSAKEEYGKPFPHEEELNKLIFRSVEIANQLDNDAEKSEENDLTEEAENPRETFIKNADLETYGTTIDAAYLVRAQKGMKNEPYSEKMEDEIIRQLLQFKLTLNNVREVVLKYSPLEPENDDLKRRIMKIATLVENKSKIAAAR